MSAVKLIKIEKKAGKGPTEKRAREDGGNDGLAFAICAARKRRKEPAGRVEAFFCLDLLVTFLSREK